MGWRIEHLSIPGASADLELDSFVGRDELSTPFHYELRLTGASLSLGEARCAGARVVLVEDDGTERHLCGVVETATTRLGAADSRLAQHHRVVLRPAAYVALSRRRGYRIFQEKSAVEIVQEVLDRAGVVQDSLDWSGVSGSYPTRVYCVQYDETDWDFVSRLLEGEGIYYAFEHHPDGDLMRFSDTPSAVLASPTAALRYLPSDEPSLEHGVIRRWSDRSSARVSRVTLKDYDMLRPSTDLTRDAAVDDAFGREHYEFPGRYQDPAQGARLAQVRLEELRCRRDAFELTSNAAAVQVGQKTEILDHPSFAGELLLTATELRVQRTDGQDVALEITAVGVDAALPFRPPRQTPRPRVVGFQTARVTGPAGAELHCDEHGRVKVQFPWHREGAMDDRSSCWIRVSQPHTTGSIMIPRVGWEVIVEFVDGDPDRPLCLGKLWNPFEAPPRTLPDQKTQTCHSSASLPGRTGVNEVVLDDAAGAERISIAGQHDIVTAVANDRMFSVGRNEERSVNGDRSVEVGGDESGSVACDVSAEVGASQEVSVGGSREVNADGTASESITGSYEHNVGGVEHIQVGSPGAALLEVIASAAIGAATGAAATAASRAQAAMLGPIAPALGQARQALGSAAQFAGPATALFAGGSPAVASFSQAAGALSNAPGALDAGATAASIANSVASGALAAAGMSAAGGGAGVWATTVGGAVTEFIGGANVINSASGVNFGIGGSNTELIGAARVELVRGGKSETTGGAKIETVGVYSVKASGAVSIDAKAAIALNVAGSSKQNVSGSHSISASGPVLVNAPKLELKASGTITLKCGSSEVVISGGGVSLEALSALDIEGGTVELTENALGS